MKQKKTIKILPLLPLAAFAAMAFTSCSDSDSGAPDTGSAITFNASAPRSRAVVTTNTLTDFKVWAFADGKPYMSDVTVDRTDNGWAYSPSKYWPVDQSLNFYSYSPAITTQTASDSSNPDIPGFVNGGSTDLLYSVNIGEKCNYANASPVLINFRLALLQVRFQARPRVAQAGEQTISVKVHALDLLGTNTVGSFNFPTNSTTIGNQVTGQWIAQTTPAEKRIFEGAAMLSTDTPTELLSTGYIFSIPQVLTTSDYTGGVYKGAFARVLCEIFDRSTGVKIWPSGSETVTDGAGYIYFPLSTTTGAEWQLGKAYRYTLNIAVPSTSSKIDFDVTVENFDDFIDSAN